MKQHGFTLVEALIIVFFALVILFIAYRIIRHDEISQRSPAYFNYLNNEFSALDSKLTRNTGDKNDFDQSNVCEYWENTDTSTGPLGSFIERAYYFPAINEQNALALDKEINLSLREIFSIPRYQYTNHKFVYDNYLYNSQDDVVYAGQPSAGFDEDGNINDTSESILQAGGKYDIKWPNNHPGPSTVYTGVADVKSRPDSDALVFSISFGADSPKCVYKYFNIY